MKRVKYLAVAAIVSVVLLTSACTCGGDKAECNSKSGNEVEGVEVVNNEVVDSEHNAENSLSWEGLYKGVLPCESCDGIETELVLNYDNTYTYSTKCLGKEDAEINKVNGSFNWIDGSIVYLDILDESVYFLVGEDFVELRDKEGKKIDSDLNHRLSKEK